MAKHAVLLLVTMLALASPFLPDARSAGSCYSSLAELARSYGFTAPAQSGRAITLKSKWTTMVFNSNSRKMTFNGILMWLNSPVVQNKGQWSIRNIDAEVIIGALLNPNKPLANRKCDVVVLDPGHGGRDSGAIGRRRVYEKKVVLDLAKRIRKRLQASGIKVYLTREGDQSLTLSSRSAKARKWKADLFVSIHANSAQNRSAKGIETYVLTSPGYPSTTSGSVKQTVYSGNKHDAASSIIGHYVQKGLIAKVKGVDRGVRRARFDVIKKSPCPAVLVECGFLSNKVEEELMLDMKHHDKIAEGIAQGILTYSSKVRKAHATKRK